MDHYKTLGVERTASAEDIKRAFRKLAMQYHPDRGGDEARFKEIQAAYDVLGNAQRRAEYDNPRPQGIRINMGPGGFDFDQIFNMFGADFHSRPTAQRSHARLSLWITLRDVAQGGERTLNVSSAQGNSMVNIEIPRGISDGDSVQYPGLAPGGHDLVVQFRIKPDTVWQRQNNHLLLDQPILIWTLITGGVITVRTLLDEQLEITVPPQTRPGTVLRVRGKGLPDRQKNMGDLLVRVQPRMPDHVSDDLMTAIRREQQP